MAPELHETEVPIGVLLGEKVMRLEDVRGFAVGQTIALKPAPGDALESPSGAVLTRRAQIGQRRNDVAVRLLADMFRDLSQ